MLYLEGSPTLNIRVVWKLTYSLNDDDKSQFMEKIRYDKRRKRPNQNISDTCSWDMLCSGNA